MSSKKEPVEQRQGKRHRVRGDAVVIFGTPEVGTGRLIDISMGGLTFDWVTSQACFCNMKEGQGRAQH